MKTGSYTIYEAIGTVEEVAQWLVGQHRSRETMVTLTHGDRNHHPGKVHAKVKEGDRSMGLTGIVGIITITPHQTAERIAELIRKDAVDG